MPPDTDTRLSMAEQLGATWDKMEEDAPATPERADPIAPEAKPVEDRARDESGRFAEKPKDKLTLKPKEAVSAEAKPERAEKPAIETPAPEASGKPGATEGKTAQPNAQAETVAPPVHWNGDGKVEWGRLPVAVRQQIAKDYSTVADLRPLAQTLAPYKDRFTRDFGGTDRAIPAILSTWDFAQQQPAQFTAQFVAKYSNGNPVDFLQKIAQQLGVDPRQFQTGDNGGQPAHEAQQGDPVIAQLQATVQQLQGQLQRVEQQPALAQNAQIDRDINAFAADPAHPYYQDVKIAMQAILAVPGLVTAEHGQEILKQAYDQACWANPQIRQTLQAKAQADAAAKLAADRKATVNRATQAGGSINGAPGTTKSNGALNGQSVAASLSDNWDKLEARIT